MYPRIKLGQNIFIFIHSSYFQVKKKKKGIFRLIRFVHFFFFCQTLLLMMCDYSSASTKLFPYFLLPTPTLFHFLTSSTEPQIRFGGNSDGSGNKWCRDKYKSSNYFYFLNVRNIVSLRRLFLKLYSEYRVFRRILLHTCWWRVLSVERSCSQFMRVKMPLFL